ncbi:type I pantothenate kinase [Zavarzinia compransoris]|uniref:type I pantothenate kinase n=1 Tax=Zavarzinia marina TaxID=2911065 RepID=UPI001F2E7ACE|nr:type I pantothenate kinase [Zavarzinia marina]MCF4164388.1 type I pantothenate kinase [Zavarzinia marina]
MPETKLKPSVEQRFTLFGREEWRAHRADTPMTLSHDDLLQLRGADEMISLEEVADIYLPLSRLLNLHVSNRMELYRSTFRFLGAVPAKVPYIIGLAGSVSVGKSTSARILRSLLARWPGHPNVELISTDGFLHPNQVLQKRGLMERKGFPESYDVRTLLNFLADVKAGRHDVKAPVYSHIVYDIVPGAFQTINQPDILIVEGLNVLQVNTAPGLDDVIFASDFFDFSIYVDAETEIIRDWYVSRFLNFRQTAFRDPDAYFSRYATLSDEEARDTALSIWTRINERNLVENIRPARFRADLILSKGKDHRVESVALRRL